MTQDYVRKTWKSCLPCGTLIKRHYQITIERERHTHSSKYTPSIHANEAQFSAAFGIAGRRSRSITTKDILFFSVSPSSLSNRQSDPPIGSESRRPQSQLTRVHVRQTNVGRRRLRVNGTRRPRHHRCFFGSCSFVCFFFLSSKFPSLATFHIGTLRYQQNHITHPNVRCPCATLDHLSFVFHHD